MSHLTLFVTIRKGMRWMRFLGILLLPVSPLQALALQPSKCGVPIDLPSDLESPQGEAEIHLNLVGQTLSLRWSSSLTDVLGFNHTAQTAQERQAVNRTVTLLQALPQRFKFDASASCKPLGIQYESRILQAADIVTSTTQEAFLFATLQYQCAVPDRLHSIKSDWFKAFPEIRRLKVHYLFPKSQGEILMTPEKPLLSL